MHRIIKRILKEPLGHFLLLGTGLFVVCDMMPQTVGSGETGHIVVTQGQIEHLATGFAKAWQRPPTPEELAGLVRERVREEVYYREAMALGLDKDDAVIRRRLRQKMEFITNDLAAQAAPSDAELTAYLQAHPDAFRIEPRFTFRQVYLNPEKHKANLARDAAELLAQLRQGGDKADPAELGDRLMLEHQFTALPASEVARLFGQVFADRLAEVSPGQWQGPVDSGYGVHLVLVTERTAERLPALAEVRNAVRRDWDNTRRMEANEQFYQQLLKRYTVTIEGLADTVQEKILAKN
jgi:hypothetical protein